MNFIFLVFFMIFSSVVSAERAGLGVMLGNPIGFNGKKWLNNKTAVDGGLGYSFGKHTNFSLHSDYLFHQSAALYLNDTYPLDLYYGVGGRMEFAGNIELGVRVPVGLVYIPEDQKSDLFAEVAPIWDFVTRTGLELHFLIGARYYFQL